jgi:hypothetical protein
MAQIQYPLHTQQLIVIDLNWIWIHLFLKIKEDYPSNHKKKTGVSDGRDDSSGLLNSPFHIFHQFQLDIHMVYPDVFDSRIRCSQ